MWMRHHGGHQTYERPLYPIRILGDDDVLAPTEVVRFAGFPFVRTTAGEWVLVDSADIGD